MLRFIAILVISLSVLGCEGPMGPAGLNGDSGTQGDAGDKGDKGSQGIRGEKGDTGPGTREVFVGRLGFEATATHTLPSYVGSVTDPPVMSVYVRRAGDPLLWPLSMDLYYDGEIKLQTFALGPADGDFTRLKVAISADPTLFLFGSYKIVVVY